MLVTKENVHTLYNLAEIIIKEFGNSSSKIRLSEKGIRSKVIIDSSKINNL